MIQKHRRHEGGRGPAKQASLLSGQIFDATGDRLTPVHANKRGKRYSYYVSNSIITGNNAKPKDGVWRIPAHEIEQLVVVEIKRLLKDRARLYDIIVARDPHLAAATATYQRLADLADRWDGLAHADHRALLASVLSRVVVTSEAVNVHVRPDALVHVGRHGSEGLPGKPLKQDPQTRPLVLTVPARLTRCGTNMKLVLGNEQDRLPRPDTRLITVVARAHRWHDLLMTGNVRSIKELARIEHRNERHLGAQLRLAFLAPDIVETILAGRQPPALMAEHLIKTDLPLQWDEQCRISRQHQHHPRLEDPRSNSRPENSGHTCVELACITLSVLPWRSYDMRKRPGTAPHIVPITLQKNSSISMR